MLYNNRTSSPLRLPSLLISTENRVHSSLDHPGSVSLLSLSSSLRLSCTDLGCISRSSSSSFARLSPREMRLSLSSLLLPMLRGAVAARAFSSHSCDTSLPLCRRASTAAAGLVEWEEACLCRPSLLYCREGRALLNWLPPEAVCRDAERA